MLQLDAAEGVAQWCPSEVRKLVIFSDILCILFNKENSKPTSTFFSSFDADSSVYFHLDRAGRYDIACSFGELPHNSGWCSALRQRQ